MGCAVILNWSHPDQTVYVRRQLVLPLHFAASDWDSVTAVMLSAQQIYVALLLCAQHGGTLQRSSRHIPVSASAQRTSQLQQLQKTSEALAQSGPPPLLLALATSPRSWCVFQRAKAMMPWWDCLAAWSRRQRWLVTPLHCPCVNVAAAAQRLGRNSPARPGVMYLEPSADQLFGA